MLHLSSCALHRSMLLLWLSLRVPMHRHTGTHPVDTWWHMAQHAPAVLPQNCGAIDLAAELANSIFFQHDLSCLPIWRHNMQCPGSDVVVTSL